MGIAYIGMDLSIIGDFVLLLTNPGTFGQISFQAKRMVR